MKLAGLQGHFFLISAVMSFAAMASPMDCQEWEQDRELCAEEANVEPERGAISQELSRERMAVLGSFSRQANVDELLNRLALLVEKENLPLRPVTATKAGSSATRVGLAGRGSTNVGSYLQTIKTLGFPDAWLTDAEIAFSPRADRGETSGGDQLMPAVNAAAVQAAENELSTSVDVSGSAPEDAPSEQLRADNFPSDEWAAETVPGATLAFPDELLVPAEPAGEHGDLNCVGTTEEILNCSVGDVRRLLKNWVLAWGAGDVDAYLSFYTKTRSPRDDMTRSQWEANRRQRVSPDRDAEINLKLESLGVSDSGLFDIVFRQNYIWRDYQATVRKRLFLLREADGLKIWKEEVLP